MSVTQEMAVLIAKIRDLKFKLVEIRLKLKLGSEDKTHKIRLYKAEIARSLGMLHALVVADRRVG